MRLIEPRDALREIGNGGEPSFERRRIVPPQIAQFGVVGLHSFESGQGLTDQLRGNTRIRSDPLAVWGVLAATAE